MQQGDSKFSSASTNKPRACLNCSIIKPAQYFKQNGCPNCPFLQTNKGRNFNYTTSSSYKGLIAVVDPKTSWVAKWQRIGSYEPGLYAMTVEGVLTEDFIEKVEQEGRTYVNRAESFTLG